MREWPADPRLEPRVFRRHITALGQPGTVKPIERAQFELDRAADLYFSHFHRRKTQVAHSRTGRAFVPFHPDIVPTAVTRGYLGVIPHVAEPLAIGQTACFRPPTES